MLSPRGKVYIGLFIGVLTLSTGYVWLRARPSADTAPQIIQPGALDLSFGVNNTATTKLVFRAYSEDNQPVFGDLTNGIRSILRTSDGKIITIASSTTGDINKSLKGSRLYFHRFTKDGELDITYGDQGRSPGQNAYWSGNINFDSPFVAALDSQNRPLIALQYNGSVLVFRFTDQGEPDTTFGPSETSGHFDGNYYSQGNQLGRVNPMVLAVQPDNKILIGGTADNWDPMSVLGNSSINDTTSFELIRLGTDGTMDKTFNNGHMVKTVLPGGVAAGINRLQMMPNGQILAIGGTINKDFKAASFLTTSYGDMLAIRYTATGVLDTDFGKGKTGYSIIPFGADATQKATAARVVDLVGQNLVLIGDYNKQLKTPTTGLAVAYLKLDGTLDTTLGNQTGQLTVDLNQAELKDLLVDASNAIVVETKLGNDLVLERMNASGGLDTSFGTNGIDTIKYPDIWSPAGDPATSAIASQPDSNLLLGAALKASSNIILSRIVTKATAYVPKPTVSATSTSNSVNTGSSTGTKAVPAPTINPADYHASLESKNASPVLAIGQSYQFIAKLKNIGTAAWTKQVVQLSTDKPLGRQPGFNRVDEVTKQPSGWSASSTVGLQEASVAPGEIGTFQFWYTIPKGAKLGNYSECFRPVVSIYPVSQLEDLNLCWDIKIVNSDDLSGAAESFSQNPSDYQAQLLSSNNSDPATIKFEESHMFEAKFKNTGTTSWFRSIVRLATDNPIGRDPSFDHQDAVTKQPSGWLSGSRVRLMEDKVAPGETGTFRFWFTVHSDTKAATYQECYRLVADITDTPTLLGDKSICWNLNIIDPKNPPKITTSAFVGSSSGGSSDTTTTADSTPPQAKIVDGASSSEVTGVKITMTRTAKVGKKTKTTKVSGDITVLRQDQPAGKYTSIKVTAPNYKDKTLPNVTLAAAGPITTATITLDKKPSKTKKR